VQVTYLVRDHICSRLARDDDDDDVRAEAKQDLGVFGYPHNKGRWSWSRLGSFYSSPVLRQALAKVTHHTRTR
jgi:hypothetical protein